MQYSKPHRPAPILHSSSLIFYWWKSGRSCAVGYRLTFVYIFLFFVKTSLNLSLTFSLVTKNKAGIVGFPIFVLGLHHNMHASLPISQLSPLTFHSILVAPGINPHLLWDLFQGETSQHPLSSGPVLQPFRVRGLPIGSPRRDSWPQPSGRVRSGGTRSRKQSVCSPGYPSSIVTSLGYLLGVLTRTRQPFSHSALLFQEGQKIFN